MGVQKRLFLFIKRGKRTKGAIRLRDKKGKKDKRAINEGMINEHLNHEKMIVWKVTDELDILVQEILRRIPKNEYILRSQIDSASDSIGSNFVEGYYSGSLNEYIRFLRYSRRSCGELQERIRRVYRKRFLDVAIYNRFSEKVIRTGYLIDRLIQSLELKRIKEVIGAKKVRD